MAVFAAAAAVNTAMKRKGNRSDKIKINNKQTNKQNQQQQHLLVGYRYLELTFVSLEGSRNRNSTA